MLIIAAIEPEIHFFQISRQVFRADMVPCSHYSALKQREGVLNRVCVDVPNYVDLCAVIDGPVLILVDSGCNHGFGITSPIVSDNSTHVHAHAILDVLCESLG